MYCIFVRSKYLPCVWAWVSYMYVFALVDIAVSLSLSLSVGVCDEDHLWVVQTIHVFSIQKWSLCMFRYYFFFILSFFTFSQETSIKAFRSIEKSQSLQGDFLPPSFSLNKSGRIFFFFFVQEHWGKHRRERGRTRKQLRRMLFPIFFTNGVVSWISLGISSVSCWDSLFAILPLSPCFFFFKLYFFLFAFGREVTVVQADCDSVVSLSNNDINYCHSSCM